MLNHEDAAAAARIWLQQQRMPVGKLREDEGMCRCCCFCRSRASPAVCVWAIRMRALTSFVQTPYWSLTYFDSRRPIVHAQNLLAHGSKCSTKVQGGCNVCRRIWALLQIHARQCRRDTCAVPKCRQLKDQLRSIQLQQDQMNERRRLAMHEA